MIPLEYTEDANHKCKVQSHRTVNTMIKNKLGNTEYRFHHSYMKKVLQKENDENDTK